ncbi:GNAT family N-acetyltransferase [Candidatus Woesearchaeota archaeon]|nr:GNAT family N-acetyltransferase [Candidatus Woesearchaeota archaeon]
MKGIAMPSEYPIKQISSYEDFDSCSGLEEIMHDFPYSSRKDFEMLKSGIEDGKYLLWVAFNPEGVPAGYVLCKPKQEHENSLPGYGFYVAERFVRKDEREKRICSRLIGLASQEARRMGRSVIYEEVDIANLPGIKSSSSLGFEEFSQARYSKDTYSLRRKKLK